jgi:hypothetical protein
MEDRVLKWIGFNIRVVIPKLRQVRYAENPGAKGRVVLDGNRIKKFT